MARELFVPRSAFQGVKQRDGLYCGAVVLVEGSGYGVRDVQGRAKPLAALVTHVYPDDEPATAQGGASKPWPGVRPFVDLVAVAPQDGQIITLAKVPYYQDVLNQVGLTGVPLHAHTRVIGYRIVTELQGWR